MTRCTRSRAFSLVSRCPTWVLAVASLMHSRAAISELDSPVAISASTSRSRPVIPARLTAGARTGSRRRLRRGGPGLRHRAAGELLHEPPGDARGQQGVAGRDDPDRVDQFGGLGALQQESAGARVQRRVHVLVQVERGQDEYPGSGVAVPRGDLPGGLDAVEFRHPHIHQHHVGPGPAGHRDRLRAGPGLADHGQAGGGVHDAAEPGPDQRLVIGDDNAQVHRGRARGSPAGGAPARRAPGAGTARPPGIRARAAARR